MYAIRSYYDLPFMQRKVRRKIRMNYGWAFLYNVITSYSIHYTKLYDHDRSADGRQVALVLGTARA